MSEPLYRFTIDHAPVAKGRARSRVMKAKKTGKTIATHYTPAKTRNFEELVADVARRQVPEGRALPTGPIELGVRFVFAIPPSWPKWKRTLAAEGYLHHTGTPDCSNLVKAIEDACNRVLWADDGQVSRMVTEKRYGSPERIEVEVRTRDGLSQNVDRDTADRHPKRSWAGLVHHPV